MKLGASFCFHSIFLPNIILSYWVDRYLCGVYCVNLDGILSEEKPSRWSRHSSITSPSKAPPSACVSMPTG